MLAQHKISQKAQNVVSTAQRLKDIKSLLTSTRSHWFTVLSTITKILVTRCPTGKDIQEVENFCLDLPGCCLKCMKFGRLLLRKITKILVTRCQILWLKFTPFDFGWGPALDTTGELTVLPQTP